jgi:UDP-glucuronate 4-epimerase
MKILVTGTAGFIGYHLVKALLQEGHEVVGIDNINDYYDVNLKLARLTDAGIDTAQISADHAVQSTSNRLYKFVKLDLTNKPGLNELFSNEAFDVVCNLAAQAGVRYSLSNPQAYLDSNIQGFLNILECCRHNKIKHLLYASSSSVYGLNKNMPFSTHNNADHPVSLYAASKKSNELMAHTYSHLFNLPTTGLRFFTVYGPWGRPDMAIYLFTKAIYEGKPIQVFNNGEMKRDFTHVNDIVDGIVRALNNPAAPNLNWDSKQPDPASSNVPYKVFNIGRGKSVKLLDFIDELEKSIGKTAEKKFLPLQDGDVEETWADITELASLGYAPQVQVEDGIPDFVSWYKNYYLIN